MDINLKQLVGKHIFMYWETTAQRLAGPQTDEPTEFPSMKLFTLLRVEVSSVEPDDNGDKLFVKVTGDSNAKTQLGEAPVAISPSDCVHLKSDVIWVEEQHGTLPNTGLWKEY